MTYQEESRWSAWKAYLDGKFSSLVATITGQLLVERKLKAAVTHADVSAAALSFITTINSRYMLESISVHFSTAVTPTITVTLQSKYGPNYNTLLRSRAITPAAVDYYEVFGDGYEFELGDEIILGITSVGAVAYVVIRYMEGGN